MEHESDLFLELKTYTVWNFKLKQCIRTLDIEANQYIYDVFNNKIILELNMNSFALFNWKTNKIDT